MECNNTTEKSILEAAERLFLEKGYALTSTTMIANEVGCNQSLVHYYYRSKENLFQLVFEKYLLIFFAGITSINDNELTFEERLQQFVYEQFEMLQAHPEIVFFLLNELTTNPNRLLTVKEQFKNYYETFSNLFGSESKFGNNGNVRTITIDLLLNIISLNTGVVLFDYFKRKLPMLTEEEPHEIIEQRKVENFRIILKSIST
jgi:AcrR family transcriptional regulator